MLLRRVLVLALLVSAVPMPAAAQEGFPGSGGVVITEIMTNPSAVLDSRGEWFEIHNPGSTPIDLSGWAITDEAGDRHVISGLVAPAGGFVVLARNGDPATNGGVPADYAYGDDLVLLNAPDRIVLLDPAGVEVDRVDYGVDGFPRPRGRSMSLIDPTLDNASGSSWCSSTSAMSGGDLGSPGAPTVCRESAVALVITEILQNPQSSPDAVGEWFEVYNAGTADIDLVGFVAKDDDTDRFTIDRSVVVPAGGYALLGRSGDRSQNGGVEVAYAYGPAMALHNSRDELVLLDREGVQVDRVAWDDGRTFPDPDGASMMLTDPAVDNSRGAAWCEAPRGWPSGDRGTPGRANDCSAAAEASQVVIAEIMFDPAAVGDRAGEWFELVNLASAPVDLTGWVVRDDDDDRHVIAGLSIPPGGRAVLAEVGDPAVNGGVSADYVYGSDLVLHNTFDELVIETADGARVDRVAWDGGRTFPQPSGASIVLASTAADNGLGANWCAATERFGAGDLGGPGRADGCPDLPAPPPLVITEIMRNPAAVADDDGEWLEIHNPTDAPVDLRSWAVRDDESDFHVVRRSVIVSPGGYAVLGRSSDPTRNGGVIVDHAYGIDLRLSNTADELVLADPHGRVVARVAWDDGASWIRPNGASMSLAEPGAPAETASSWCESGGLLPSGDRATPGAATTCAAPPGPGRVVISEIHRDPAAVPDSLGEWVELHNPTEAPVDLAGWTLRDDDWDEWVIRSSLVIPPGGYVVVGKLADPARNGGAPVRLAYGTSLFLYNRADELVLLDPDRIVVDRVAWTTDNGFPLVNGAAMALRSPGLDNSLGASWCAATTPFGAGDGGTPGGPNDCLPQPAPACGMSLHAVRGRLQLEVRVMGLPRFEGDPPVIIRVTGPNGFGLVRIEPLPVRSLVVEVPAAGTYTVTASATDGTKACLQEASATVTG